MARGSARFELNRNDLRKLLQQEGLEACEKIADQILDIAGPDYEMEPWVGRNRGRVTVRTIDDWAAMGREARDHNLIQALGQISG